MDIQRIGELVDDRLWNEAIIPYINERISIHVNRLIAQEDVEARGKIKELQAFAQLKEIVRQKKDEIAVDKQENRE